MLHVIKKSATLVAVLMREMEMIVVGVSEKQAKGNQMQKRSGRTGVEVLGLVPADRVRY